MTGRICSDRNRSTASVVFIAVVLLVASTMSASAKCTREAWRTVEGQAVTTNAVTDGTPCTYKVGYSGSPIYGVEIVAAPKHGTATRTGKTTVVYKPSARFKGADSFTLQWVGLRGGTTPTSWNLNVNVTVK